MRRNANETRRDRRKERKNTTVGVEEARAEELKSSFPRVKPPEVTIPQAAG